MDRAAPVASAAVPVDQVVPVPVEARAQAEAVLRAPAVLAVLVGELPAAPAAAPAAQAVPATTAPALAVTTAQALLVRNALDLAVTTVPAPSVTTAQGPAVTIDRVLRATTARVRVGTIVRARAGKTGRTRGVMIAPRLVVMTGLGRVRTIGQVPVGTTGRALGGMTSRRRGGTRGGMTRVRPVVSVIRSVVSTPAVVTVARVETTGPQVDVMSAVVRGATSVRRSAPTTGPLRGVTIGLGLGVTTGRPPDAMSVRRVGVMTGLLRDAMSGRRLGGTSGLRQGEMTGRRRGGMIVVDTRVVPGVKGLPDSGAASVLGRVGTTGSASGRPPSGTTAPGTRVPSVDLAGTSEADRGAMSVVGDATSAVRVGAAGRTRRRSVRARMTRSFRLGSPVPSSTAR